MSRGAAGAVAAAYAACDVDGASGGRFHLWAPKRDAVLSWSFLDACARPIAPPGPLAVREFEDVVLEDSKTGVALYDASGRRIAESCLFRHDDGLAALPWQADERASDAPAVERIDTPVVYHSAFFQHWGHFLLESIARSWACLAGPRLAWPGVFSWAFSNGSPTASQRDFFAAAGLPPLANEGGPRKLAMKRCFVPAVSFATGGFADPLHLAAPRRVAERLGSGAPRDPRPVYLSRLSLQPHAASRPRIANEAELERALVDAGARVVRMEALTLSEQIDVMNSHRVFIGPWGSALHNLVFCLRGPEIETYVLVGRFAPTTFILVDAIVGVDAHYLATLSRAPDFDLNRTFVVDVEATLAYLRARGAI